MLAACSSTPQSGPDAGDAGGGDTGTGDTGVTDAGNSDGDAATATCIDPTSGTTAKFAANAVTLPTHKSDFAFDLDGDGKLDNQFGAFVGALVSQGMDLQTPESAAVTAGRVVILIAETSDDATGQSDPCAGAVVSMANATASAPKFDGTDSFTAGVMSGQFVGAIAGGELDSENPATATTSVQATLRLALFDASTPIDVPLVGAEVELKRTGALITSGRIHGAIRENDVQQVFIPGVAASFNAFIASNPSSATATQLLQTFDNGGVANSACGSTCKTMSGTCAVANDGTISDCEVGTSAVMSNLLAPDVQLFDSQGNWHPTPGGTTKDSLSFGIGLTAVKASF